VRHFRAALALQADFPAALCSLARAQSSICDWSSREATLVSVRASLVRQLDEGACPALQPFDAFAVPLELPLVLRLAQAHAAAAEAVAASLRPLLPPGGLCHPPRDAAAGSGAAGATRLRVGYVSADFGDHPLTHLTRGLRDGPSARRRGRRRTDCRPCAAP